jgi:hypothetical protein
MRIVRPGGGNGGADVVSDLDACGVRNLAAGIHLRPWALVGHPDTPQFQEYGSHVLNDGKVVSHPAGAENGPYLVQRRAWISHE